MEQERTAQVKETHEPRTKEAQTKEIDRTDTDDSSMRDGDDEKRGSGDKGERENRSNDSTGDDKISSSDPSPAAIEREREIEEGSNAVSADETLGDLAPIHNSNDNNISRRGDKGQDNDNESRSRTTMADSDDSHGQPRLPRHKVQKPRASPQDQRELADKQTEQQKHYIRTGQTSDGSPTEFSSTSDSNKGTLATRLLQQFEAANANSDLSAPSCLPDEEDTGKSR